MANTANYAQISETLIDHPKTTRAIRMLRMNRMQFVGHLVALWNWALKNAADGDLSRFTSRDIADAARFTDPDNFEEQADIDAERFVRALIECQTADGGSGFLEVIDGELLIHDWEEFGGKLHAKREANKSRMRAARSTQSETDSPSKDARATHVQRTTDARGAHSYRRGEERREEKQSPLTPNRETEKQILAEKPWLAGLLEEEFATAKERYRAEGKAIKSVSGLRRSILDDLQALHPTPPPPPAPPPSPPREYVPPPPVEAVPMPDDIRRRMATLGRKLGAAV